MSGISTSFSPGLGVREGEGESTTDGIRPWPCLVLGSGDGSSVTLSLSGNAFNCADGEADTVAGAGEG